MISTHKKTILKDIIASVGAGGILTTPKVANAKVILCAKVKAVMVLNNFHLFGTKSINANTNSKWSIPLNMCSIPMIK